MSNCKSAFLIVVALAFLIGCGDAYDDDNPYQSCSKGDEEIFVDTAEDTEKTFVDLTDLKIIVGEDCVGAYITLLEMPPDLTYNHSELPDGDVNYQWSVYFDMNDDNQVSEGDLILAVTHAKFKGTQEMEGPILSVSQDNVLVVDPGGETRLVEHIYASISDNTLHMSASKSAHAKLSEISAATKVKFKAIHNDGTDIYADVYPDSNLFE